MSTASSDVVINNEIFPTAACTERLHASYLVKHPKVLKLYSTPISALVGQALADVGLRRDCRLLAIGQFIPQVVPVQYPYSIFAPPISILVQSLSTRFTSGEREERIADEATKSK